MKRITRASVAARAAAAKKTIVTTTTSTPPRTRRISPVPAMTPSVVLSSPVVRTGTTKTTVVTPSPRPQKRKCPDNNTEAFIEKKKAPLFSKPAAVPSSAEAATTTTTTIRRDTIRRLVESSVLDGICESCNDDTTTAAVDTEEIKIKGDDSNINHTNNTTVDMRTLGGWCLVDALFHCANASDAILAPLILKHGPPSFYLDYLRKQTEATKKTSSYHLLRGVSLLSIPLSHRGGPTAGRGRGRNDLAPLSGSCGRHNSRNRNSRSICLFNPVVASLHTESTPRSGREPNRR